RPALRSFPTRRSSDLARVILASHLGRPKGKPDAKYSLRPVARRLGALLGEGVSLAPDCVGPPVEEATRALAPGGLLLLENLRFQDRKSTRLNSSHVSI